MLSTALLIVFIVCSLFYGRAARTLKALEKERLESEAKDGPKDLFGAAADVGRRFGIAMIPSSDELESYCAKTGKLDAYRRANRILYSAIAIAAVAIFAILKIGPTQP